MSNFDPNDRMHQLFLENRYSTYFLPLGGVTAQKLITFLWRHRDVIEWRFFWFKLVIVSFLAILGSIFTWFDELMTAGPVSKTKFEDPVFVLGAHRSGTTYLHTLLSMDPKLTFPTTHQVGFPTSFNTPQPWRYFTPNKRPMDNATFGPDSPQEEEYAMFYETGYSWYTGIVFDYRADSYLPSFTMDKESVGEEMKETYANTWIKFLKRVTYANGQRRLVLKTPTHTSKIPLILELFPNAKFIFIHRDPYRTYRSSVHLHEKLLPLLTLGALPTEEQTKQKTITDMAFILNTYLETKQLIPKGNLVEIGFDDLMTHPLESVRAAYEELGLDFTEAEKPISDYVDTQKSFKKNAFQPLPDDCLMRVNSHLDAKFFHEYGYEVQQPQDC
eukprot:m.5418 g.5418  ORF g.5418 m.5418 type:complete len:387 (-) comp4972_c0_seq1:290-1450(-)